MGRRSDREEIFAEQRIVVVDPADHSLVEVFCCPFCLTFFCHADLHVMDKPGQAFLSVEDAPQRSHSLGGQERCLSCRERCNNSFWFETVVVQRKREEARLQGMAPDELRAWVLANEDRVFQVPSRGPEFLYELKTAYVIAFAALGTAYILNSQLDQVRELLKLPKQTEWDQIPAVCGYVATDFEYQPRTILRVEDPSAYVVIIPPNHSVDTGGSEVSHGVYLPTEDTEGNFYSMLADGPFRARVVAVVAWPDARRFANSWQASDETRLERVEAGVSRETLKRARKVGADGRLISSPKIR